MADPIGFDERIADILIERAEGALCQNLIYIEDPETIEKRALK